MDTPVQKTVIKKEFSLKDLSGIMIALIISGGFLACVILFIFGKRQIMRYAIRNKFSPHYPGKEKI